MSNNAVPRIDTTPRLGSRLDGPQPRDAVHITITAVQVGPGEILRPGQRVGLLPGSTTLVARPGIYRKPDGTLYAVQYAGIIDPYADQVFGEGDWVYLCLDQGSITTLRHEWTHPAFERRSEARATEAQAAEAK